jgi:hypothetical protein
MCCTAGEAPSKISLPVENIPVMPPTNCREGTVGGSSQSNAVDSDSDCDTVYGTYGIVLQSCVTMTFFLLVEYDQYFCLITVDSRRLDRKPVISE